MSVPPSHNHIPVWPADFAIDSTTPYFTPPSEPPLNIPDPDLFFTPPSSPALTGPDTDDHFPQPALPPLELVDDDGLTTLEKIYLYASSKSVYHRVFIVHALPEYLRAVSPQEAIQYVFPLIKILAMDDDEGVKEALAAELVPIIWWFFTDCQIIPNNLQPDEAFASSSSTVTISVQAFTPILGTLLLSCNPLVGGAARLALVDLLARMKKADVRQSRAFPQRHHPQSISPADIIHPWEFTPNTHQPLDDDDDPLALESTGLFGKEEREMFTHEILQGIIIGMGKLDLDCETEQPLHHHDVSAHHQEQMTELNTTTNNPYFPPLPPNGHGPVHHLTNEQNPNNHHTEPTITNNNTKVNSSSHLNPGSPMKAIDREEDNWDDMPDTDEQAAVGRLSSMSLIAAVTASGVLAEEAQPAFVAEVVRVGHDKVYWVRREASFALGALAKVVPQEVVINSLLPLFITLRQDPVWHVRHSALFALPAILSRLPATKRRQIALETILSLSADKHPTVRSGVLEALGEVIYTFHEDSEGPPEQLIHLFLGRKEDRRVRDGQQEAQAQGQRTPIEEFYADPKRPLICAFNFPAVTHTLGGARWNELREAYSDFASNMDSGVGRTLAASLGELAKIIGPVNSRNDLVDVWMVSMQSEEEEVRTRAIESLHGFIEVLGKEVGQPLVRAVLTEWNEGRLRSWRERELIEKCLVGWVNLIGPDNVSLARAILRKGLEDPVAVVREAATFALPEIWDLISVQSDGSAVDSLRSVLEQLATSSNYRRRMTFIACQQTLALSMNNQGQLLIVRDENILRSVADLASDGIEGVRIGVARFAASVHYVLLRHSQTRPNMLQCLVQRLLQDSSHEVRSYVARLSPVDAHEEDHQSSSLTNGRTGRKQPSAQLATFSRPPSTLPTSGLVTNNSSLPHSPGPEPGSLKMNFSEDSVRSDAERGVNSFVDLTDPSGDNGSPCESGVGPITTSTGLRGMRSTAAPLAEMQLGPSGSKKTERVTVPV